MFTLHESLNELFCKCSKLDLILQYQDKLEKSRIIEK